MPAVQHMVLVRFKSGVSQEKIDELFALLRELPSLIPGITHFSGGPYSSPEGMNQGYTHGFLMTFDSVEARNNYLPHPEHERVKAAVIPFVEAVVAFDYETDSA